MVTKRMLAVVVPIVGLLGLCLPYSYHFIRRYQEVSEFNCITAYESGNDAAARISANRLGRVDPEGRAFYLANVDVSDSISMSGQARTQRLSVALARLENAWFHWPGANERYVFILKASLSALLGDTSNASVYAKKACALMTIPNVTIEDCLSGRYSFGDPEGSRWSAVRLYEDTTLYNAIGAGSKANSKFYEAVALKYFDLEKAHKLIAELRQDGLLTDEMLKTYCNPASPPDHDVCGKGAAEVELPDKAIRGHGKLNQEKNSQRHLSLVSRETNSYPDLKQFVFVLSSQLKTS